MKRIYITFGGQAYDHITERVAASAHTFGVDELRVYDDRWLMQTEFYRRNRWLWEWRERWGFGWNCWKAYIVFYTMAETGSSSMYENTGRTAYGTAGTGTAVSGGAVGDKLCIIGRDSTHYLSLTFQGTWTMS